MSRFVFVTANFAILCVLLVVGLFTYLEAGRLYADNVIFISPIHDDARLHFTPSELESIRASFPNYEIITAGSISAVFRGSVMQARGDVIFTSPGYYSIHFLDIVEGSLPQGYANSVLLSEPLAWRLFGARNVTGLVVWMGDEPYTVSGVAAEGSSNYTAWMHESAAPAMSVSSIYVRLQEHSEADAFGVPREILLHVFQNPNEFAILDVNKYVEAMGMRNGIVLHLLWIFVLVVAMQKLGTYCSRIAKKEGLRSDVPKAAVAALFVLVAAYVLFVGINELILLLPNLSMPEVTFRGFLFGWFTQPPLQAMSPAFLRLMELNTRMNFVFFGSLIAMANLIMHYRRLKPIS